MQKSVASRGLPKSKLQNDNELVRYSYKSKIGISMPTLKLLVASFCLEKTKRKANIEAEETCTLNNIVSNVSTQFQCVMPLIHQIWGCSTLNYFLFVFMAICLSSVCFYTSCEQVFNQETCGETPILYYRRKTDVISSAMGKRLDLPWDSYLNGNILGSLNRSLSNYLCMAI